MKIVSAKEIKSLDEETIRRGMPRAKLMENAGRAVYENLFKIYGKQLLKERVLIVLGCGNNAGDGLVVARLLHENGISCRLCLVKSPEFFRGETRENFYKVEYDIFYFLYKPRIFQKELSKCTLIVDALFGTGLHRNIRGPYRQVIEYLNRSKKPTVAIDIPSGIHGTTGEVMGTAVCATHTVTLGLPKKGLVVGPAIDYVGELHICNIGFSKRDLGRVRSDIEGIGASDIRGKIPKRRISAHKGSGGHVLAVAGSLGKTGAAYLSTQAAFRTGTGLVTLLTHPQSLTTVAAQVKEAFLDSFPENTSLVKKYLDGKSAVAIGPGMGFDRKSQNVLLWVLTYSKIPIVVDADGLTILSEHLNWLKKTKASIVLTPHPGEMARLIHGTTSDVQKTRLEVARDFAKKYQVYVVLKGARTVVATPKGKVFVNLTGNPALATAGSGDVLTGMIASLVGQGMAVEGAVKAAVFLHGKISEVWCRKMKASRGLLASDLLSLIPKVLEKYSI